MKNHFFYAMASLSLCLAVLCGCDQIVSYETYYMYQLSVEGPNSLTNADKLEAYLIELGAPAENGKLENATIYIKRASEQECDQEAIRQFNEIVKKIDYEKIKEMGLSLQHNYSFCLLNVHYLPLAEWNYPNENVQIDTVPTHADLGFKMIILSSYATYCNVELLMNDSVVKTFSPTDTLYSGNFNSTNLPKEMTFSTRCSVKDMQVDSTTKVTIGYQYSYSIINYNKGNEVLSSNSNESIKFALELHHSSLQKWVDERGNRTLITFNIDGKNTTGTVVKL